MENSRTARILALAMQVAESNTNEEVDTAINEEWEDEKLPNDDADVFFDGYDSDKDPEYVCESEESTDNVLENETENLTELHEDENPEAETSTSEGRPPKGRKRKSLNMSRIENKKNRNSNKMHYNHKRQIIESKMFDEQFRCNCTMQCDSKVSLEQRRTFFNKYWELAHYDAQTAFIGASVHEAKKKRTYGQGQRVRNYSRIYHIDKITVCREMFIKTLNISTKRINTSLNKLRSESLLDRRGKQQGGKNKIDDEKEREVVSHINKIPRYQSHYRRHQCNGAEFLPPEMTLSLMYRQYREEVTHPVGFQAYRRIFRTKFNLKFKSLKKDTCVTCDKYTIQHQGALTDEAKDIIKGEHDAHITKYETARKKMKEDLNMAKENKHVECLTFDLENFAIAKAPNRNIVLQAAALAI